MKNHIKFIIFTALFLPFTLSHAASITSVPHSPFIGPQVGSFQGAYRPYDTTGNHAFQGNGAQPAVASGQINAWPQYHQPHFANDGNYGNGRSWIPEQVTTNSWIKIDLGDAFAINDIHFGRDRLGFFNDRDPGQFIISVAQSENVYAMGDETNDENEYTIIVDSAALGFSGIINGSETLSVSFDTVTARYIKIDVESWGTAIDDIEVFSPDTITVAIDIKPGSLPNSINLGSSGVIPVAIFSDTNFDATTVRPETVALAGASVRMVGKSDKYLCHTEDINADGLDDLVCQVYTAQFMIEPGEATVVLEALTTDGTIVRGEDSVRIVQGY
jgi:hypothetical protein